MRSVHLTVNGVSIVETVEPRLHLADLLRERLGLTGTHLRCEQGACGACTLLIDGQPARSCITYPVLCEGAQITTIEGLENDPVMAALRRAFMAEHGLQCGFCTPGMLITARDIVTRLPNADERRIRLELSGNLCRCTGYVGIVRAVRRVLEGRRAGAFAAVVCERTILGPVGSGRAAPAVDEAVVAMAEPTSRDTRVSFVESDLGLVGKKPNIEIRQSFVIARPQVEVWNALGEIESLVPCLPGATLTGLHEGRLQGQLAVKLGPISAVFSGEARVVRDEPMRRGVILGAGTDRLGASRASAELEYRLSAEQGGAMTRLDFTLRVLLLGPLAQFGRSAIANDLAARISGVFARNLERQLAGLPPAATRSSAAIPVGSLLAALIIDRMKNALARLLARFRR
jgi:aerobic carbon-monoxide dehydrogenase small subunit